MTNELLSAVGMELANELILLSQQHHVKSDARDILGYEAANIEAKAKNLIDGCGIREDLQNSTLLSEWGKTTANKLPDLTKRVRTFHNTYQQLVTDNDI